MHRKTHPAEGIVDKLRSVDGLVSPDARFAEAIRSIAVTEITSYCWRSEYGGLKSDQVKRLKSLETENRPLRQAISDLTLEKLILKAAVSGNFRAWLAAGRISMTSWPSMAYRSGLLARPVPAPLDPARLRRAGRGRSRPDSAVRARRRVRAPPAAAVRPCRVLRCRRASHAQRAQASRARCSTPLRRPAS
jgi:putative transposase